MTKKNIKIRIIACVLTIITVFSVGAITVTSASAASSNPTAVNQVSGGSLQKTVEQFFVKGIDRVILKKDIGAAQNSASVTTAKKTMTKNNVLSKLNDLGKDFSRNHNIVMACFKIIGMAFNR